MNLLVLDQFSDLGGAQRQLLDLLPAMREAGWKVLVGMPGEGELFRRVRDLGFETASIECGPYRSGSKSLADMARFVSGAPFLARQIGQLLDKAPADLLYLNGPRLLPAAALRRPRVPVLFHSHSVVPPGKIRLLAGASLRRLNARVVGVCRFVADRWRECVGDDRVSVVYNGVAGPAHVDRRPHGSAPVIGCIGRIAPEKGQREFVEVARLIRRDIPEARFVIHGAALFGDAAALRYDSELRKAAKELPVEFAGWTADVYTALEQLDLLLVPSAAQEATTRVILEAFSAGVPVVAFASGGIPEIVTHGVDGFLAASVEKMARLAIDALRCPSVSEQARGTWEKRFTLERYRTEMMKQISYLHSSAFICGQ
jgi:glycosyltransferase involved in cell wall biosynthesis